MIDDDCKVIMEVHNRQWIYHSVSAVLSEFHPIPPLNSTMDIRADAGFLRDFPNIHVARSYINNHNH